MLDNISRITLVVLTLFIAVPSMADLSNDIDSLGGNKDLLERARALQPNKTVSIVQKRMVEREWRHEFSPEYINAVGGDSFLNTQMIALNYHLHINPRWAVGATYLSAYNELTKEGDNLINVEKKIPDVDAPQEGYEAVANWYPIYGKFSLYDLGVVQFDFYLIGSYGRLTLQSGETDMFSFGGGLGLWLAENFTARFELRSRRFSAQRFNSQTDMDLTTAGLSLGVML